MNQSCAFILQAVFKVGEIVAFQCSSDAFMVSIGYLQ